MVCLIHKDMKGKFYQQLHETITVVQKSDVNIVMGEMIGKIGSNKEGLQHVMDRHGCGNVNKNGELFSALCASCDLIIGGTVFPHAPVLWKCDMNVSNTSP